MRGGERVEYHSEKIKIRQQVRMATSALLDERCSGDQHKQMAVEREDCLLGCLSGKHLMYPTTVSEGTIKNHVYFESERKIREKKICTITLFSVLV